MTRFPTLTIVLYTHRACNFVVVCSCIYHMFLPEMVPHKLGVTLCDKRADLRLLEVAVARLDLLAHTRSSGSQLAVQQTAAGC
jgi:hypothetical protein